MRLKVQASLERKSGQGHRGWGSKYNLYQKCYLRRNDQRDVSHARWPSANTLFEPNNALHLIIRWTACVDRSVSFIAFSATKLKHGTFKIAVSSNDNEGRKRSSRNKPEKKQVHNVTDTIIFQKLSCDSAAVFCCFFFVWIWRILIKASQEDAQFPLGLVLFTLQHLQPVVCAKRPARQTPLSTFRERSMYSGWQRKCSKRILNSTFKMT